MMTTLRAALRKCPGLYGAGRRWVMCWRRWRHRLRRVHRDAYVAAGSWLSKDLAAAAYSYIGPGCLIGPKVQIGPYSMLGPRVSIVGADHVFDHPGLPIIFSGRPEAKTTVIEADAWIGCGAILIAGVTIGRGAVVAAGAVVTKDVPAYEIHGGVPNRKLGERFAESSDRWIHDRMLSEPPQPGKFCEPLEESKDHQSPFRTASPSRADGSERAVPSARVEESVPTSTARPCASAPTSQT